MNKKEKYNGWTNYATWRVNLEVCDGMDSDAFENMGGKDVQEYIEEIIFKVRVSGLANGYARLVEDYARAFLSDVNWWEIQEAYNGADDE